MAEPLTPTGLAAIGIDGKLLIAQLFNFALVFILLKFFAFKPIIKVLAERRKRIADSIKNAELIEVRRKETEEKMTRLLEKASRQGRTIVEQAKAQAKQLKQETTETLKQEEERMTARTKQAIEQQTQQALNQAKTQLSYLAVKLSEKILATKLDAKKDDQMLKRLLKEVR